MTELYDEYLKVLPLMLARDSELEDLLLDKLLSKYLPLTVRELLERSSRSVSMTGEWLQEKFHTTTRTDLLPTLVVTYPGIAAIAHSRNLDQLVVLAETSYSLAGITRVLVTGIDARVLCEMKNFKWLLWSV